MMILIQRMRISVLFELSKQANYYLMEKNTATEVIDAFIRRVSSDYSLCLV